MNSTVDRPPVDPPIVVLAALLNVSMALLGIYDKPLQALPAGNRKNAGNASILAELLFFRTFVVAGPHSLGAAVGLFRLRCRAAPWKATVSVHTILTQ
jgi:hypothetical protein